MSRLAKRRMQGLVVAMLVAVLAVFWMVPRARSDNESLPQGGASTLAKRESARVPEIKLKSAKKVARRRGWRLCRQNPISFQGKNGRVTLKCVAVFAGHCLHWGGNPELAVCEVVYTQLRYKRASSRRGFAHCFYRLTVELRRSGRHYASVQPGEHACEGSFPMRPVRRRLAQIRK